MVEVRKKKNSWGCFKAVSIEIKINYETYADVRVIFIFEVE